MTNISLNVAQDFYPRPAGRYAVDGKYTGEGFRKKLLVPNLNKLSENDKLIIDFTGVTMAGSSFLEEAFGGLVRVEKFDGRKLLNQLDIVSPRIIIKQRILDYINDAIRN